MKNLFLEQYESKCSKYEEIKTQRDDLKEKNETLLANVEASHKLKERFFELQSQHGCIISENNGLK